jgi:hypothetical protein
MVHDTLYNITSWIETENERIREQSHELLRHHVRVIGELLDEIAELEIR